jgi:hypothetical protein
VGGKVLQVFRIMTSSEGFSGFQLRLALRRIRTYVKVVQSLQNRSQAEELWAM